MPREYQSPIRGRTLEPQTPDPVGYEVAARPVDTTVAPSRSNGALKLAESLSVLHSGLTPFVQKKLKEEEDKQYQQGMLGYLKGEDSTDQSESYKDGYMKLKWDDFGRQAKAEVVAEFEKNITDPTLDVNALIRKKINDDLAGIQEDPRAIEAYTAQMMPLISQLSVKHSEYHKAVADEEAKRILHSRMSDITAEGRTVEEMHQMYTNDWPTWQAMGKTRKDMGAAMWDNLLARAEQEMSPELLEMAYLKDGDGISIASVVGADKVGDAQRKIDEARTKKRLKDNMLERDVKLAHLNTLLETNPNSPELDFENLVKLHGPEDVFNKEGELPTYWAKVLTARGKGAEDAAYEQHMMSNLDPVLWKAQSQTPEFKKFYDKQTAAAWAKLNGKTNDPATIGAVIQELTALHERSGVPPRELVGIFENINVASVNAANGQVSPDIILALQMNKVAKDSGKGDLIQAYTKDASRAYLSALNDRLKNGPINGETIAAAAMTIKLAENDEQVQANKAMLYSKQFEADLTKKVTDQFSGWFDFNDATNMSDIVAMAKHIAVRDVTQHRMSPEAAMANAVEWVTQRYTRDSSGYAFAVHQNDVANKDDIAKGVDLWLKDYQAKNGEIARYAIRPAEDGQTYRLFDGTSGLPVATMTSTELLAKSRPASFGNVAMRADAAALMREVVLKLDNSNFLGPELLTKLNDNPQLTEAFLVGGNLSMRQKLLIKQQLKGYQRSKSDETQKLVQKITQLTKAGNVLTEGGPVSASIPAKLRDGTPGNVGELAAYYYKQSPKAALAMVAEGLVLTAKPDSDGSLAIGFGYNFGGRTAQQAQKDLRAAGVATSDIAAVMAGQRAITTEQAIKLFEVSSKSYEETAKKAFGDGYDKLPPHVKAVLFDMAYNAGSPSKFSTTLKLFQEGKYEEAAKGLTLKYKDKEGKWKNNERRVRLWREMLSGKFDQYLSYYTRKKG